MVTPGAVMRQVEVFVMSKSGFAFSAAYSAVPVRGVWMQRDVDACTWSNYNDHCLMRACPGQVKDTLGPASESAQTTQTISI